MTENPISRIRAFQVGRRAVLKGMAGIATVALLPRGAYAAAATDERVIIGVRDLGDGSLDISATGAEGQGILGCVFDSFFDIDEAGKLAPGVIDKWELSPDRLTWTFTARDDVFFHEGVNADGSSAPRSKLTAEDIAFSLTYNARDAAQSGARAKETLGFPVRTEIVDDRTVRLFTPTPKPTLPVSGTHYFDQIMFVVPKDYIEKNGEEWFKDHPIGTGPYRFVSHAPGDSMEFEAATEPHWSGRTPGFKFVTVLQIPEETTTVLMLRQGELDVSAVGIESAEAVRAAGLTIFNGSKVGCRVSLHGVYRTEAKDSPLSNIKVRESLSLAINRQEIVDNLLRGLGDIPAAPPRMDYTNPDWTPALVDKWKPWFEKAYRYDPAEAQRLLTEAGYPNGFSFDFWSVPDGAAPFMGDLVQVCAGYWTAVGVNAVIIPADAAAHAEVRHTKKSTELIGKGSSNATVMNRPVSIEGASYFVAERGPTNLLDGSPLEAEVDALYTEGLTLPMDTPRYEEILDRIIEITAGSWTAWHVVAGPLTFAFSKRVVGQVTPGAQHLGPDFANFQYAPV